MAYKDEYEVARLYTDGDFLKKLAGSSRATSSSSSTWRRRCWPTRDPATGQLKKREFGAVDDDAVPLLAKLKRLRGTAFDSSATPPSAGWSAR